MVLPVIDGPGTYRLRNGQKVEVVYFIQNTARRLWYGHSLLRASRKDECSGASCCWKDNGHTIYETMDTPYDVVGRADAELLVMAGGEFAEPI